MTRRKWNLWIDDVRDPRLFAKEDWREKEFIWATGVDQAKYLCELWGPPAYMALDHDLGWDEVTQQIRTVPEFLQWLFNKFPETPPRFRCHTSNPEGRKNMTAFMESWAKSLEME